LSKLRKVLFEQYSHLQAKAAQGEKDDDDFFPYVYTPINVDFRVKT
jgi:hypothetical protein